MKIFYSAYTCQGNIGDLLISKYQIEEYAKYGKVYVDCHGMPEDFQQTIFLSNEKNILNFEKEFGYFYRSRNIIKVLRIIKTNDFTHFCGSPGPREILEPPYKKMLFKLLGNIIPRFFLPKNIKCLSIGVDLNYKTCGFWGRLNRWYFNFYDVIGLRSQINFDEISKYQQNTQYVPDMAFLYPFFNKERFKENKMKLAISFRQVDDCDYLVNVLRDVVKFIRKECIDIDIIYQVKEDYDFCKYIADQLKLYDVNFHENMIQYDDLKKYDQYDFVISNRLHVLLMGAMNGAVPYAIISKNKKEKKIVDMFSFLFSKQLYSYINESDGKEISSLYFERMHLKKLILEDVQKQRNLCVNAIRNQLIR